MTISSTNRKAGPFVGNDSSTAFPFAFKVFQASDVYVVRLDTDTNVETVLVLGSGYSISLNADQNANPGGTVALLAGPLATGYTLTITSNITPLQQTDLTNQGGFYPAVVTNALDKITILVQQILERLGRSLTLPLSLPSNVSTALPLPEANKALAWNSTGTALENYDASQLATSIIGSNTIIDRFVGDGTVGPYPLSAAPLTINNTIVGVGGVLQAHDQYSIGSNLITFVDVIANGVVVEVLQQIAVTYPMSSLTPGVVQTVNISDDAVTTTKIANESITLAKIASAVQALISGALQRAGGVMTGPLTLDGDATDDLHAVPLQQVEDITNTAASKAAAVAGLFRNLKVSASGLSAAVAVTADELVVANFSDGSFKALSPVNLIGLAVNQYGANGLDTGLWAVNTWYSVWVIWNGTTIAGLFSVSAIAPTMPAGYTHKARVGWIRTDSSGNKYPLGFVQYGRSVQYVVGTGNLVVGHPQPTNGVATGSVSLVNFVPPTASAVRVLMNSVNSTNCSIYVGSVSVTANGPGVVAGITDGSPVGFPTTTGAYLTIFATPRAFFIEAQANTATYIQGWEDNL